MRLRRRGGYDVPLAGRPAATIQAAAEPDALYLPLASRRFTFSEPHVRDGQKVRPGEVLARDPDNFGVPLLAPRAGTADLKAAEGHVVLKDLAKAAAPPYTPEAPGVLDAAALKRRRLLDLGAWQFFEEARTGRLPDPAGEPAAVIVSTVRLEPFGTRGDALLAGGGSGSRGLDAFARGLEHLQSLLSYQPIHLVIPEVRSRLAEDLRESLRGRAYLQIATIRPRYPMDHFALLARGLGLKADRDRPVWALRTEGVLAVDRALGAGRPVTERVIAIGGPAARSPRHMEVTTGYPLRMIREGEATEDARLVGGGVMTGDALGDGRPGLDAECAGLTALAPMRERQLFGWIRPGWDRHSYSRLFLSRLRPAFAEPMAAAVRGERRACVACGQCEEVCPARILPHVIHKYLYQDSLDDAERLGVDLCVGCGLCSYVCPSKIELRREMLEAQERLREERRHAAQGRAGAQGAPR